MPLVSSESVNTFNQMQFWNYQNHKDTIHNAFCKDVRSYSKLILAGSPQAKHTGIYPLQASYHVLNILAIAWIVGIINHLYYQADDYFPGPQVITIA